MQQIIVDLFISREEWLKLYRGETHTVFATSRDGRSIKFPANILTKYTTQNGVEGSFVIQFTDEGKFQSITRL
jgi:hypothetical protein